MNCFGLRFVHRTARTNKDFAERIHSHQQRISGAIVFFLVSVMVNFANAKKKDRGASLTLEEMKKLAHVFKVETEFSDNRVGGLDQIAAITKEDNGRRLYPSSQSMVHKQLISIKSRYSPQQTR
jgi:hypothetical protein